MKLNKVWTSTWYKINSKAPCGSTIMVFHPYSVYFIQQVAYLINQGFGQRTEYSKIFVPVFIKIGAIRAKWQKSPKLIIFSLRQIKPMAKELLFLIKKSKFVFTLLVFLTEFVEQNKGFFRCL